MDKINPQILPLAENGRQGNANHGKSNSGIDTELQASTRSAAKGLARVLCTQDVRQSSLTGPALCYAATLITLKRPLHCHRAISIQY